MYHDLGDLLRVVSVQVKPESHHLPVVGLQLTLCYPVSSVGDLDAHKHVEIQLERRRQKVNR